MTKPNAFFRVVLFILFAMTVQTSLAATRYIDDKLLAPLRSGEGLQFRIVNKGLPSGTRIELLESSSSGYSKVRTSQGQEGWLPTRLISKEPIARDQLAAAKRTLKETTQKLTSTREQLKQLQSERDNLADSKSSLENRAGKLSSDLDRIKTVSSNTLQINQQNKKLQQNNQELKKDVEVLTVENKRLEANKESDFMLLGAALVALGVLIAIVVPWLKMSRKTDNWV